jgi:hypothetical protein
MTPPAGLTNVGGIGSGWNHALAVVQAPPTSTPPVLVLLADAGFAHLVIEAEPRRALVIERATSLGNPLLWQFHQNAILSQNLQAVPLMGSITSERSFFRSRLLP